MARGDKKEKGDKKGTMRGKKEKGTPKKGTPEPRKGTPAGKSEGKLEQTPSAVASPAAVAAAPAGKVSVPAGAKTAPLAVLRQMIDDEIFGDVTIACEGSRKIFHAHEFLLARRCPELMKIAKKTRKGKVADPKIEEQTVGHVIEFLYSDLFPTGKLNDEAVIKLNKASHQLKLERLTWLCAERFQSSLSMKNIHDVLKLANQTEQADVKGQCIGFIMDNYQDFIKDQTGVGALGVELFMEIVQMKETKSYTEFKLGAEPTLTIHGDLVEICNKSPASDFIAVVGGNKELKAHRAMLAFHSKPLKAFFQGQKVNAKVSFPTASRGKKAMDPLSPAAAQALLAWCYHGEPVSNPLASCELVPWAKDYGLPDLRDICEKDILANINERTALSILGVAYLEHMKDHADVAKQMIKLATQFTLDHLPEVDLGPLKRMDPTIARDILTEEQNRQKRGVFSGAAPAAEERSEKSEPATSDTPQTEEPKETGESAHGAKSKDASEGTGAAEHTPKEQKRRHHHKNKGSDEKEPSEDEANPAKHAGSSDEPEVNDAEKDDLEEDTKKDSSAEAAVGDDVDSADGDGEDEAQSDGPTDEKEAAPSDDEAPKDEVEAPKDEGDATRHKKERKGKKDKKDKKSRTSKKDLLEG